MKLHPSYGVSVKLLLVWVCLREARRLCNFESSSEKHILRALRGLLIWQVGDSATFYIYCVKRQEPQQVFDQRVFLHRLSLKCFYNHFRWHIFLNDFYKESFSLLRFSFHNMYSCVSFTLIVVIKGPLLIFIHITYISHMSSAFTVVIVN